MPPQCSVAPPATVPCYYRAGLETLTQAPMVDVLGGDSSGEGEWVLIETAAGRFIGCGSDHTDRKVEAYSIMVSKQMCPKPISRSPRSSAWHRNRRRTGPRGRIYISNRGKQRFGIFLRLHAGRRCAAVFRHRRLSGGGGDGRRQQGCSRRDTRHGQPEMWPGPAGGIA